jgi:uridine phosphorylase
VTLNVAVEMEAAALYAFAAARDFDVACVAHVTNTMATDGDDFEKGEADGAHDALEVVAAIIERLRSDHADAVTNHAAPPIRTPDGDS